MSEILCIQSWPRKSGVPEDTVEFQWVFHYGAGDPDATALDDIQTNLQEFWDGAPGFTAPGQYMANSLVTTGGPLQTLFFYDITAHLDGSNHGSPIGTRTLEVAVGGTAKVPAECCTVLTYHRPYATDVEFGAGGIRPRARDRGRLYFGPLCDTAIGAASPLYECYLVADVLAAFTAAAEQLMGHTTTTRWAQWSRADASVGIVDTAWMDNAVDIQRRRGNKATSRTTVSV